MSTVKSTESRIFNFSLAESALMVCMAGLQVFIVRFFFQGARKGEFVAGLMDSKGNEANELCRLCVIGGGFVLLLASFILKRDIS